jgi:hypothetical protein
MTAKELYDRDFFEWTRCNAALLRAGRFTDADVEHIAEEIEDMGKRDRRELGSRLEVLITHLLKWQAQPARRETGTWRATINTQRRRLRKLLREMPSLARALGEGLDEAYADGLAGAVDQTRLPRSAFPPGCPFTLDQILDEDYFPE